MKFVEKILFNGKIKKNGKKMERRKKNGKMEKKWKKLY